MDAEAGESRPRRVIARRTAGLLVLVVGLLSMASVLRPGLYRRVEFLADLLPDAVVSVSAAASVAVGLLLAALAVSVARGRRRAWRVVIVLLGVEVVLQLGQAHHLQALVSLVLLVLLVLARDSFVARSVPLGRSRALTVGGILLGASVLLGWLAISALADAEGVPRTTGQRLADTLVGFVGITTPVTAPETRQADAVYYLLVAMAATTVLVTGVLLLRAPRPRHGRDASQERQLAALIERYSGNDSLAYFALRDDRAEVWTDDRRTCVSYRQVGATLLAAGDPIGLQSDWPVAIRAFLGRAESLGAVPAVVAASESGAMAWARHGGLTALEFGDESVLEVDTFTLDGREMRNVRQAVSRAERSGAQVTVRRLGDVPDEEVEQLRDLCDLWRGMREERGFSMSLGRLDAVRDPRSVVVVAHVEDHPRALLSLVPWGSDGLSLDLMRRDPHAPSGINELMIARLMSASPTLGVRQVSLNFAPFREAIERSERFGAPPGTRLWGRTLRMVSSASQADSLYRFNAKFRPEWRRRFLVYPPAVGLPRVTLAYLRAEGMLPTVRRPDAVLPLPRAAGSPVDATGADAAGVDAASVDVAGVDAAGVDVDQQSGGGA